MKVRKTLLTIGPLVSAVLVFGGSVVQTRADYASSVLANNPVHYWRLNETVSVPTNDVAFNIGSLGAAANGDYVGATHPVSGIPGAGGDTAANIPNADNGGSARIRIPYLTELNANAPFTVEFWAKPANFDAISCAAAAVDFTVTPRKGWLFYQGDSGLNTGHGWNFRLCRPDANKTIAVNMTLDASTWYHVVGVYDGTNIMLYVNGALAASAALGGAYAPTSPFIPMTFGARADGNSGWYGYGGDIDEPAYYGSALTEAQVKAHYQAGSSSSPAKAYKDVVLADAPLGYWRLGEPTYTDPGPATTPAVDSGSAGTAGNATFNAGMIAGAPGPAYSGLGANNKAGHFPSFTGGYVGTPASLNDLAKFTVMGWIMRPAGHSTRGGYFGQNDLLEFGDADNGANIELWINAYGGNIKIPYPFKDNEWGFLAVVGDGSKVTLYANGLPVGSKDGTVTSYGTSDFPFNIGGGGIFNDPTVSGDYFYGSVDEVAIFNKALSDQQIRDIFFSAEVPPQITKQPAAPARDIYVGNIVTLSVTAVGNPPLSYQWRKAGTNLSGQTNATLVFNGITDADAGSYDVVVSNPYGSAVSASVTLTIEPAETVAPTLVYAAGNQQFNGVRVWFSEPLDPASAQTAANYQLSGGLTVSSATLSAPAGTPGDNIVDLVTSLQTTGTVYTLTVTGVKDQVQPANTIAPGSTIQFISDIFSPGFLSFEVWTGLSTTDNSIVNTLLADPRFPDSPSFATYTTAFSSRPVYADDTHEGYGGKMAGWLLPQKTADYRFFLSSDDSSRLYLSQSPDPEDKVLIAEEVGCCQAFLEPDPQGSGWHDNGAGMGQTTLTPIHLVAGQRYYVEAIWKEGTGGDYCNVAWREEGDATAAADLPVISGQYLTYIVDPNVDMSFVVQPTDQLGYPATSSSEMFSKDFSTGDGGFTVVNTDPAPPGPWTYNGATWAADGGESGCTGPYNSQLNSPTNTMTQAGAVLLTFKHRYSFESTWDAGQVRVSVNGGAFTLVPAQNFILNGYTEGNIQGNGIALGQRAFTGDSPGYADGTFITSQAILGTFSANDKVVVQFVGAWDDCTTAQIPGWEIQSVKLELLVGAKPSTFTAEATVSQRGQGMEFRYQWQRNDGAGWVNIPDATSASFQITPTQVDMNASFRVMVTAYAIPGKVIYSNTVKLVTEISNPTILVSRGANGISITFTGKLTSATKAEGPYTEVSGAQSPYIITNPTGAVFYRAMR